MSNKCVYFVVFSNSSDMFMPTYLNGLWKGTFPHAVFVHSLSDFDQMSSTRVQSALQYWAYGSI